MTSEQHCAMWQLVYNAVKSLWKSWLKWSNHRRLCFVLAVQIFYQAGKMYGNVKCSVRLFGFYLSSVIRHFIYLNNYQSSHLSKIPYPTIRCSIIRYKTSHPTKPVGYHRVWHFTLYINFLPYFRLRQIVLRF